MTLYTDFCAALNSASDVAVNSYLQILAPYVKDIERASTTDAALADYCKKMTALVQRHNFALNAKLVNEFAQLFGEAHFATLCSERSVAISKIPEQANKKTPDFLHSTKQQNVYFEVKTLSVVHGSSGINGDLLNSLNAQLEIEKQQKSGAAIAIGVSESRPYSDKANKEGPVSAVISTLIEKARQNIKSDQYANPNTFLVLNLCMIAPSISDNRLLRPAYCDDYMFPKAMTGELWMLAFAQPGMLVHGCPEFEGKPCIESIISKSGVLADSDYKNISGLLVIVYPLKEKPCIYGLYRSADYNKWNDGNKEILTVLNKLNGDDWNDDGDTNGPLLIGPH